MQEIDRGRRKSFIPFFRVERLNMLPATIPLRPLPMSARRGGAQTGS